MPPLAVAAKWLGGGQLRAHPKPTNATNTKRVHEHIHARATHTKDLNHSTNPNQPNLSSAFSSQSPSLRPVAAGRLVVSAATGGAVVVATAAAAAARAAAAAATTSHSRGRGRWVQPYATFQVGG